MSGLFLKLLLILGVGVWSFVKVLRSVARWDNRLGLLAREMLGKLTDFGRYACRAFFWAMVIFLVVTIARMTVMRWQSDAARERRGGGGDIAPAGGAGRGE